MKKQYKRYRNKIQKKVEKKAKKLQAKKVKNTKKPWTRSLKEAILEFIG